MWRDEIILLQGVRCLEKCDVLGREGRLVDVFHKVAAVENPAFSFAYGAFFWECSVFEVCPDGFMGA